MRGGTGSKRRVIRALGVNSSAPFSFNRSINPNGGNLAKMKICTRRGSGRVKIFQDTNSDGRISRKELIFHGKAREAYNRDELINFSGTVRLKKTMHRCNWLSMKFPGDQLMCTIEYIPTIYELTLINDSGEVFQFRGIGKFNDPILQ